MCERERDGEFICIHHGNNMLLFDIANAYLCSRSQAEPPLEFWIISTKTALLPRISICTGARTAWFQIGVSHCFLHKFIRFVMIIPLLRNPPNYNSCPPLAPSTHRYPHPRPTPHCKHTHTQLRTHIHTCSCS